LVIVITGVWNQKKPDLVIANAQSTIWVVPKGSSIATNAKLEGRMRSPTQLFSLLMESFQVLYLSRITHSLIAPNYIFMENHFQAW